MLLILSIKKEIIKMGKNARKIIEDEYSSEIVINKYLQLLN